MLPWRHPLLHRQRAARRASGTPLRNWRQLVEKGHKFGRVGVSKESILDLACQLGHGRRSQQRLQGKLDIEVPTDAERHLDSG